MPIVSRFVSFLIFRALTPKKCSIPFFRMIAIFLAMSPSRLNRPSSSACRRYVRQRKRFKTVKRFVQLLTRWHCCLSYGQLKNNLVRKERKVRDRVGAWRQKPHRRCKAALIKLHAPMEAGSQKDRHRRARSAADLCSSLIVRPWQFFCEKIPSGRLDGSQSYCRFLTLISYGTFSFR